MKNNVPSPIIMWATGHNYYGQLGDGTNTNRNAPVEILSSGVSRVVAGNYCSFILKNDGSLWAAGQNESGQLGDGTTISRNVFVKINL